MVRRLFVKFTRAGRPLRKLFYGHGTSSAEFQVKYNPGKYTMIVRGISELLGTDRDIQGPVWSSRRFLIAQDGVGFTLTETTTKAGSQQILWYKHHVEANYVIEGEGEVENLATGEIFPLGPGSMYALDKHEKHRLKSFTAMRLVCVFTPALTGKETHDEDGSYLPSTG